MEYSASPRYINTKINIVVLNHFSDNLTNIKITGNQFHNYKTNAMSNLSTVYLMNIPAVFIIQHFIRYDL